MRLITRLRRRWDRRRGKLLWKSYGDTGCTAVGVTGRWFVYTNHRSWILEQQRPLTRGRLVVGYFDTRQNAMKWAQGRETEGSRKKRE